MPTVTGSSVAKQASTAPRIRRFCTMIFPCVHPDEVQDAFCEIDANNAKILGHGMRSFGSMARITSATIVAPQRHAVEARVHGMHAS